MSIYDHYNQGTVKNKTISRRAFLKTAGVAGTTAAASSAVFPSISLAGQQTFKWKMATTWPVGQSVLHEAALRFAQRVKLMSSGRLTITVHASGKYIKAENVFDAVSKGTLDIASSVAFYQAARIPASQWFASVPYGLNAQGMNAWLYSGGGLKLWEEVYAPHNVIPRPFGNTGVEMGGWFKKKLNHVEDFKGLKMRMPGLGGKVIEKAGAVAVQLMGDQILNALKSGKVDAAEWIGPVHDMEMGLHKAAKFYYYPGWQEPGACIELIINSKTYNALSKDLQTIVDAAAAETNLWTLSEYENRNFIALEKLVTKHGVQIKRYPKSVLKTFRTYAGEVLEEVAGKDPVAGKVHQAYKTFLKRKRNWDEISERPYYESIDSKLKDLRRWMLPDNPY